jgi:hypothetical protein
MELGVHCHEKTCKQLDFLPLTCTYCQLKFCQQHFKSLALTDKSTGGHQCSNHPVDSTTIICPMCGDIVRKIAGRDPNQLVNEHINQGCKSKAAQQVYANGCTFKGCTKRELVPIVCQNCRLQFCIRHRLEADHTCAPKLPKKQSKKKENNRKETNRKECLVS